jgi:hypothetical protein
LGAYFQHYFSYAVMEGNVAREGKEMGGDYNVQAQECGVQDQGRKLRVVSHFSATK